MKFTRFSEADKASWVQRWRASGASMGKFARHHGLSQSSLYRWAHGDSRLSKEASLPGFTEVRVAGAEIPKPGVVELCLPGGKTIRLIGAVDAGQLRVVLEALGAC